MQTIGIISDTHGYLAPRAYAALADCDAIIHAGDIGQKGIVDELAALAPVTAVYGNCDYPEMFGSKATHTARLTVDGVRFLISHYPKDVAVRGMAGRRVLAVGEAVPAVCVHGHTHVPKLLTGKDAAPAQLVLCPGSASRPRDGFPPSIARVTVDAGRIVGVSVESLNGGRLMEWNPSKP